MAKINQAIQDLLRYNAAMLPQKRSRFDKSHSHTTTFDSAYLVPLMWDRVLPGDEKQIRYSGLARMATPIHPVMDEANLDVWAFYVPDRLWWNHAKEFYGENKDASFNPDGEYVMPYITPDHYLVRDTNHYDYIEPDEGSSHSLNGLGSLNDYFGFPRGSSYDVDSSKINALSFRATVGLHRCYQLIWNEWFRNSSIQPALQLNDGDNVTNTEWSVIRRIRKVNKYPDYFTTLLREPQAGDDVLLPLGDYAPVVTRDDETPDQQTAMRFQWINRPVGDYDYGNRLIGFNDMNNYFAQPFLDTDGGYTPVEGQYVRPSNLWADLSSATAATVNNLRAAITVQQLLEIDSAAGKRYQQILQAHFGVFTPDATLQRPELLGATRTPIGMRQVLQTSETTSDSPQGNVAAFSLTSVSNEWICNKAFTEPGFIIVLGAVRTAQSYSQGLNPLLTKLNRYDHYYPVFDNLGNQPVPTSALYAVMDDANNPGITLQDYERPLGYAEAWTEYRVMNNRVSGLMRPDFQNNLSSWNYSVDLGGIPALNSDFIQEDPQLVDRTIAVPSEPQFILDSYFEYFDTKPMGVHSIPGLTRL